MVMTTCCLAVNLVAQAPRVLEKGKIPDDKRLGPLKTLNGHFPFRVPETAGDWHRRAEFLRQRVLVATGLMPMPEKTPLKPVIHGKVTREGFTIERVYFESLPGHFVSGLLFRPEGEAAKPRPGVLSPHGHGGRQQTHSDAEIKRQLANGAEHFEGSGSMPKLARCAQLARMGCVSFIFDMLGYVDSNQISHTIAHRHKDPREEEKSRHGKSWTLYSIDADLRLQSIMNLQTWNAIRALDFLASLPDVDSDRLAVTGGSGGGTQSILLGAIDERIKVSFPNGMVSTSMQGGCYCENCNHLRVGSGNVELAALFAPRPQAMTAADDWTRDMMTDGYPQLRLLYAMIGNESDVYCRPMLHFKHNYNYVTRATMYQWMNKHLELGLDDPVVEGDFLPLTEKETTVWTAEHPAPKNVGPDHERDVCKWLDDQSRKQFLDLELDSKEAKKKFTETMMAGWRVLLDVPTKQKLAYEKVSVAKAGELTVERGLLREELRGASLPLLTVSSAKSAPGKIVIWANGNGKQAAFEPDSGKPTDSLKRLAATATVLLPDVLGQGEFNDGETAVSKQRLIDDKRSYSAFTFGYNRTLFADRVGDMLAVIGHANNQKDASACLLCTDGSASWAVGAASAVASGSLNRVLVDTQGFRFSDVETYADADFLPGAAKYGDLPALLAFCDGDVTVSGEDDLERANQIRSALGKPGLKVSSKPVADQLNWLLADE